MPRRTWGMRCSASDVAILLAGFPATWLLARSAGAIAGIVPFALAHFLLFCNVFRVHRTKELWWAAIACVQISAWFAFDAFDWRWIVAAQSPVTVLVIALEMRGPWYHGVGARRINARLDDYLGGRLDAPQSDG